MKQKKSLYLWVKYEFDYPRVQIHNSMYVWVYGCELMHGYV